MAFSLIFLGMRTSLSTCLNPSLSPAPSTDIAEDSTSDTIISWRNCDIHVWGASNVEHMWGGGAIYTTIHCDQLWWALNRYKIPIERPLPPNTTWAKCIHITYRQAQTTDSKCSMQTTYHTLSGVCVTEIERGRGCTSEWDLGMRRLRGARAPSQSLDAPSTKYQTLRCLLEGREKEEKSRIEPSS